MRVKPSFSGKWSMIRVNVAEKRLLHFLYCISGKKITTFAAAATSKLASYVPSCQYYDIEVWSHARKKQQRRQAV